MIRDSCFGPVWIYGTLIGAIFAAFFCWLGPGLVAIPSDKPPD